MLTLNLTRHADWNDATCGILSLPNGWSCYTIERPWADNTPSLSCIPCGIYPLRPTRFNRGGYDTYEIADVPDRSLIKIHVGNLPTHVLGCVALGESRAVIDGVPAVSRSRVAFERFMQEMSALTERGLGEFQIEISFVIAVP